MDLKKNLSIADILSLSWEIFVHHFQSIAVIALVVYIPIEFLLEYIPNASLTVSEGPWNQALQRFQTATLLEAFIGIIATIAIAWVTKNALQKKELSFGDALSFSCTRYLYVLGTSIMMGLAILVLLMLLIIPGIIFSNYWQFAILIAALNQKSGSQALSYSKQLVQGRWWKAFGYALAFGVLTILFALVFSFPYSFIPEGSLFEKTYSVIFNVLLSYFSVVSAVFFLHFEATKKTGQPL